MHNPFLVHALNAWKESVHDFPSLVWSEFVPWLNLVEQLSAFQQLDCYIYGIFWLEHSK